MRTRSLIAYMVAATAAVAGAGSLLLFVAALATGPYGFVDLEMPLLGRLAWDAGLCLLFFVQHSGMLRRRFRARLARILPVHTHGVLYTIASAAALVLLVVLWQPAGPTVYQFQGAARWIPLILIAIAVTFFGWAIGALRSFDAFGTAAYLAHGRHEAEVSPRLAVAGPYRFVRHPFYFSAILAFWAASAVTADRLLLNALFTGWTVLGAFLEERDLAATFGEEYRAYQRTVPMLIPGIKRATGGRGSSSRAAAGN